jgi:cob(II)yrinic acid a,c-diamide reductase
VHRCLCGKHVRLASITYCGGAIRNQPPILDDATGKTNVLNMTAIEPADFRTAMRFFPAAVHVATTDGVAGLRGITVSAATSVSDRPPTILICVNREHPQNGLFAQNGVFALNTLAAGQAEISRAFANGTLTREERFAHGAWSSLATGAPVLDGAAAVFDCEITDITEAATHSVMFGRVKALRHDELAAPLIYANRRYHRLGDMIG